MRERLKESGLEIVGADAERQLARFRATYEPFLGSLAQYLMAPLPKWFSSEEHFDNWENNKRGATAKKLVEAITPEPGA